MDNRTLETIPNPIIIYNSEWNIQKANKAAIDALGFTDMKELINKSISSFVHLNDQKKLMHSQKQLQDDTSLESGIKLLHTKKTNKSAPKRYLSQFTRLTNSSSNESISFLESAICLEEKDGAPDQPHLDLNKYKLLSENVHGLEMFLIDEHHNVHCKLGQESYYQGWHKTLDDRKDFLAHFSPEIIPVLKPLLKIAFELTPVIKEFSINKKYYSISLFPLDSSAAERLCVVVLQNITITKLIENKLKVSVKKAEDANRAKDIFVAKMSHEIRTPLNAIIGFTEQLKHTRLTKKQTGYLDVVSNSSKHLLTILEDILVLSKIESGNIDLDEVPFRITDVFREIDQFLELKYRKKGLTFSHISDALINPLLLGDVAKLKQILINLCNNAIKYTHKGQISLRSTLIERTRYSQKIGFEVEDSGIGIPQEEIKEIFKPFNQVNNSLDRSFSGCGLGLTISKDLVKSMGGELTVKSTLGQGSTFAFTLSFRKSDGKKSRDNTRNVKTGIIENDKLRILFVDDDPVNILLGKIILKKQKIKADFASHGEEALKFYKPGRYNIIFLDINMPGLNGIEVTQQIRALEKNTNNRHRTAIVAMTANAVKKNLKQYLNAETDSILLKPYSENALLHKIIRFAKNKEKEMPSNIPFDSTNIIKEDIYNLDNLLAITKEDQKLTLWMLTTFVENSENLLSELEAFLAKGNYTKIGKVAHKLIPSVEHLGIKKAAELLKLIEHRYLEKKDKRQDPTLVREAIKRLRIGITAIKRKIHEMS